MAKLTSAGLLMYRKKERGPEMLLVHYGGPFWAKKDAGAWGLPKGEMREGEEMLEVAKREFEEETSFKPEGEFTYLAKVERPGKEVHAWYFMGDCDPTQLKSNTFMMEWPPKSGKQVEVLEVDKGGFFTVEEAKIKMVPYQMGFVEAFEKLVAENKI